MARTRSDISERIVKAAGERFLREGVDGASLRQIARDAGTNIGMIYYYFPTKDDLFLGVVERVYAGFLRDLAVALAPDAPVEDRIRRMYERVGAMTDDEFAVIRMILREAMISSSRLARMIERSTTGHLPLVVGTLADGLAHGELTDRFPPVALMVATFALGFVPQVMRRLVADKLPPGLEVPEREVLARVMADILFHGVRAAPPSPPPPPAGS